MEYDAKCKRGSFIGKSTDIREMFAFAKPAQVLETVTVYTSHLYGSMLRNFYGEGTAA